VVYFSAQEVRVSIDMPWLSFMPFAGHDPLPSAVARILERMELSTVDQIGVQMGYKPEELIPNSKKGLHADARNPLFFLLYSGAGCRFRTGHLMITNQLLYQMS
jgi:hypothetical protein